MSPLIIIKKPVNYPNNRKEIDKMRDYILFQLRKNSEFKSRAQKAREDARGACAVCVQ